MALALTWLRSTSHASDAPKSASTITSEARTSFATRRVVWREDNRRVAMGDRVNRIAALASVDFTGGSVT